MKMYEALMRDLRDAEEYGGEEAYLIEQAADAIEELSARLAESAATIEKLRRIVAKYHAYDSFLYAHGCFHDDPEETK